MRKRLRNNLVILLLINISIISVVYCIDSTKLEDKKNNVEESNLEFYCFASQYFLGASIELLSLDSTDISQSIEISLFFEDVLPSNEEIFYLLCITGPIIFIEYILFSKYISPSFISENCTVFEIEGVNVSAEEFKIFTLIQEYINYNRVFNKEKVALFIKSRNKLNGNLNYNGIKTIIDSLIKKNLIKEGSKLTRKTVLLNTNRRQMYNLIKKNPGIYKNSLAKKLNLSPFVIKWHLSMLLMFSLIREINFNGHIGYFDSTLSTEKDIMFYTLSHEKCNRIIEFLKIRSGCTKNKISQALKMHHNTVTKYLNELDKFELILRKYTSNKELLYLNEDVLNQLKYKLIQK
ncbi:MAG: winged helix-turn-helix transcriptional regulator [Promethearchaeota archaeon]